MLLANILGAKHWFEVLQTTPKSQTAVMMLPAGGESEEEPSSHPHSDQVLLVLEGELEAEVGAEVAKLGKGDSVTVPAGVKHRFVNRGRAAALTFNVYSPPAYPAGEKG